VERLVGLLRASSSSTVKAAAQTWRAALAGWRANGEQSALRRACGAMLALEQGREQRQSIIGGVLPDRQSRRHTRLVATSVTAAGCAIAVVLAVSITRHVGSDVGSPDRMWFAGLLDALGDFWDGLGPGGQALVLLAGVGLLVVGGGFLVLPVVTATGEIALVTVSSTAATAAGTTVLAMSAAGEAASNIEPGGSSAPGNQSTSSGATASGKSTSPVWRRLKPFRGKTRTNGLSGSKRQYYEWDYTHNDIEVYNRNGVHQGSMDPITGKITKPAVPGRTIDV
jgi:hypothetical protein